MRLMEQVWKETTATIGDRTGLFALFALGLFLPPVLNAAWVLATTTPDALPRPGPSSIFALLTTLAALWAQLATVVAAATSARGGDAARAGLRRLLPALGIEIVVGLLFLLLLVPLIVVLVRSGIDFQAMSSDAGTALSGGSVAIGVLNFVVFLIAAAFIGARLVLLTPVIALERRGLGALARSWRLTRGLTWRIIGVCALFVVVIGVSVLAAQSVVGVIAAIITGTKSGVPAFAAAVAGAAATAALGVVAIVFTARLWLVLTARHPA